MEQKGRDYSKGLIYKIQHNTINDLVYVGSTINFTRRKNEHKSRCNNENNNTLKYRTMRANGGWDTFRMVVVKLYSCNNKRELDVEEERYRVELQASLNDRRCYRTEEEITEQIKDYQKENREAILEQKKNYYETNKETILEQQKNYREANKEAILEYKKDYYEANKEKAKEKFNCDCGGKYTYSQKSTHEKSKKHQQFLQQQ